MVLQFLSLYFLLDWSWLAWGVLFMCPRFNGKDSSCPPHAARLVSACVPCILHIWLQCVLHVICVHTHTDCFCLCVHHMYNLGVHHTSVDFTEFWIEKNIKKIMFLNMSDFAHGYHHIHAESCCFSERCSPSHSSSYFSYYFGCFLCL